MLTISYSIAQNNRPIADYQLCHLSFLFLCFCVLSLYFVKFRTSKLQRRWFTAAKWLGQSFISWYAELYQQCSRNIKLCEFWFLLLLF